MERRLNNSSPRNRGGARLATAAFTIRRGQSSSSPRARFKCHASPSRAVRSVLTAEPPTSIAAAYVTPRASRQKFSTSQLGAGVFGIYAALHNPAAPISFQDLDDVREVACSLQEGASRPGNAAQIP